MPPYIGEQHCRRQTLHAATRLRSCVQTIQKCKTPYICQNQRWLNLPGNVTPALLQYCAQTRLAAPNQTVEEMDHPRAAAYTPSPEMIQTTGRSPTAMDAPTATTNSRAVCGQAHVSRSRRLGSFLYSHLAGRPTKPIHSPPCGSHQRQKGRLRGRLASPNRLDPPGGTLCPVL